MSNKLQRAYRLVLGACLALTLHACHTGPQPAETAAVTAAAVAMNTAAQPSSRWQQQYASSCALCHVTGNANAPRIGVQEDWGLRLQQGEGVLVQHTIEGFNKMPPLGYCMSCERQDLVAIIRFMTAGLTPSQAPTP